MFMCVCFIKNCIEDKVVVVVYIMRMMYLECFCVKWCFSGYVIMRKWFIVMVIFVKMFVVIEIIWIDKIMGYIGLEKIYMLCIVFVKVKGI